MTLGTILIIVLVIALLGAFPLGAGYNRDWGYAPSGGLGIVLVVVVVLLLVGRL